MKWIRFWSGGKIFFRSPKGRIRGASPPPVQPDERVYTNVLHPGAQFHIRHHAAVLSPAWELASRGREAEA